jgi:hypothetical protein
MMRAKLILSAALFAALVRTGGVRGPQAVNLAAQLNEWQAAMRVVEFGYGSETVQVEYDYNIYQNDQELVRKELTYMSRNPIAEVGRDIHLIDFRHGTALAFNKHADRAVRYKIEEPGARSSLGDRRILNHLCTGTRYELESSNGDIHISEQWVMADGDFREPLLRIEYNLGPKKELLTLSVAAVTQIATAGDLPAGLFAAPGGLEVMEGHPGPPY